MTRKVVAVIDVEDDNAIKKDLGTIDYLKREFGWLEESGIFLSEARILDDDDEEDIEAISMVEEIFS